MQTIEARTGDRRLPPFASLCRAACTTLMLAVAPCLAQSSDDSRSHESVADRPDFSGTWERYAPPRDPNAPPPRGTPGAGGGLGPTFGGTPPPLKPEFAAAYEADENCRVPGESLSLMAIVAVEGEPSVAPLGADSTTEKLSPGSGSTSSRIAMVNVLEVASPFAQLSVPLTGV